MSYQVEINAAPSSPTTHLSAFRNRSASAGMGAGSRAALPLLPFTGLTNTEALSMVQWTNSILGPNRQGRARRRLPLRKLNSSSTSPTSPRRGNQPSLSPLATGQTRPALVRALSGSHSAMEMSSSLQRSTSDVGRLRGSEIQNGNSTAVKTVQSRLLKAQEAQRRAELNRTAIHDALQSEFVAVTVPSTNGLRLVPKENLNHPLHESRLTASAMRQQKREACFSVYFAHSSPSL